MDNLSGKGNWHISDRNRLKKKANSRSIRSKNKELTSAEIKTTLNRISDAIIQAKIIYKKSPNKNLGDAITSLESTINSLNKI